MSDWTEKYRPRSLSAIRGNNKARDQFREWAESWDDHGDAIIVYGSPGVGKTSAAHALANDMGWETVELNASDQRTASVIERFAGRAAMNATLGGSSKGESGRQLIVLDEADNIHGNYDRGGARAITKLVKEAGQPMVLIANEFYEMSRGLRNACESIEFRDVSARSIVPVLRDICRQEGIEYQSEALQRIADANSGDLRGAVNDLQAAAEGRDEITEESVATSDRDRSVGIFEFLDQVLKEESAQQALYTSYDVDETPDDLTKWVEDNMLDVYEGEEIARAYEFLANADRWLGRVRASQDYSYWRYAGDNLAAGVAAARDGTKGGWTRYGRPQFWRSKDKTGDEVARRVAESSGVSMSIARRRIVPYLSVMTHHCKPRDLTVAMAAYYEFEEKHVAHVTGSGESTNKVQSIVEDAGELRGEAMEAHSGGAFAGTPSGGSDGDAEAAGGSDSADGVESTDDPDGTDSAAEAAEVDDSASESAADGGDADEADSDDGQSGLTDFF
ncbi:AAA family ATPase [Haloprofundus marisrubri]|uniref:Replication factor C large subunit n=1 Tax=Haloprofundus marisrubri TaxID=1514971 RepID=A0A0W1R8G0_9EURY|nr:replication factor C large subunit [Haloprofundus marisrubri]KTG09516.1 AAA family ATPase [Haloprofundus marisrubri]